MAHKDYLAREDRSCPGLGKTERCGQPCARNSGYCLSCRRLRPKSAASVKKTSENNKEFLKRKDRPCPGPGNKKPCGRLCPSGQGHCALCWAEYRRFYKYGITEEEYQHRLLKQKNACAICTTTNLGRYGRFHIDHDHKTKKIRGLLCTNCNLGLGLFKDSTTNLNSAIAYLTNL